MSIQGAMAASLRRFDPFPQFDLALDFKGGAVPGRPIFKAAGRYLDRAADVPGLTYARSGADLIVPASGGWRRFAANVPPIVPGYGMESPDGTTNKSIGKNAKPTPVAPLDADAFTAASSEFAASGDPGALFSVEDLSAHIAADPDLGPLLADGTLSGFALVIDNPTTSNAWVRPAGQFGNLNTHAASAVCKVLTASPVAPPNVGLNTATVATHPGTAGWVWFGGVGVPPSTSSRVQLAVRPGGKAAFLLWQGEEKPYVTPPVVVDGAQASRGNPLLSITGLGGVLAKPHTQVVRARGPAANDQSRGLLQTDAGVSNSDVIRLSRGSSNNLLSTNAAGANVVFSGNGTFVGPLDIRVAQEISETSIRGNLNGGEESTALATATVAALSRMTIATSAAGTLPFMGAIEFVGIISRGTSNAERKALAA